MLAEYRGEAATEAFRCEQCQREGAAVCHLHRYHVQQEASMGRRRLLLPEPGAGGAAAGDTLAEAAIHGRLDAVERLLTAGADPNDKGQFFADCAPLYWAVYYGRQRRSGEHFGRRDVEVYSQSAGAFLPGTVNSADPETGALTVEYTDSKDGLRRGLRENTAETAHGDGKAVVCSHGVTKFKVITPKNQGCLRRRSIVGMLLDSGANPIWKHPRGGTTPLHVAAEHGDIRALELLLQHPKAEPNVEDQYHTTPLACAAQWGHTECHAVLLKAGAHPGLGSAQSATTDDDNDYIDSLLGARTERERRFEQIMARRAKEKADAEALLRMEACRAWVRFCRAMDVYENWRNRPLTELEQQAIALEEAELQAAEEREQARIALEQEEMAMEEARTMEAQAEQENREAEVARRVLQIEEDEAHRAMQEAKAQQDVADAAAVRELSACDALKAAVLWKEQTATALARAREVLAEATRKNQAKCEEKVAEQQTADEKAQVEVELAQEHYAKTKNEADFERQKSIELMRQADKERVDAEEAKVKLEQELREAQEAGAIASEKANAAHQASERAQREQRELEEAQRKAAEEKQRLVVEQDKAKVDELHSIHLHDELQNKHEQEEKAERECWEAKQAAQVAAREQQEAQQAEEKAVEAQNEAREAQQYAAREQEQADQARAAVRKQREVVSKAEVQVQSRMHVLKTEEFRVKHYQELLDKVEDAKNHRDRRGLTRIKQDQKKAQSDLTEAKRRNASAQEEYDKAQEDLKEAQQTLRENIEHMSKEAREAEKAQTRKNEKEHEKQLAVQLSLKEREEAEEAIKKKLKEQEQADEAQRVAKAEAVKVRKQAKKKLMSAGSIYKERARQQQESRDSQDRELRDARSRSEELLKAELVETHGMDEPTYEYVKGMMKMWKEQNRWLEIKLEDLIAAWVYSMGPGGAAPNFCDCGFKPPKGKSLTEAAREAFDKMDSDGNTTISIAELAELCRSGDGPQGKALSVKGAETAMKAAETAMIKMDTDNSGTVEFSEFAQWWKNNAGSCTCSPDSKNFKIFHKLNLAMRVIHSPNESPPGFKWLSYHLANAVDWVPGAQELEDGQVETLYRGQAANAHGGPYWSVSEKCTPPNGEKCDSSCTKCYRSGDTVVWNGYTSTSRDRTAAEEFAGHDGVLFEIVGARPDLGACFNQSPPLSAWPNEAEILLPAGATFKVLSHIKNKKPGELTHVKLEHLGEWLPPPVSATQKFLHQCAICCGGASRVYEETTSGNVGIEKSGSSLDDPSTSRRQPNKPRTHSKIHIDKRRGSLLTDDPRTLTKLAAEKNDRPLKYELVWQHGLAEDCFDAIETQVDEHRETESAKILRLAREDWIAAWLYSASAKPESPECAVVEKFNESMRRHVGQDDFQYLFRGLGNAARGLPAALKEEKLYRGDKDFSVDRKQYQRGQRLRWDDFRATTLDRAKAIADASMNGVLYEIIERPEDGLVNAGFSKALPLPPELKRDDEFVIAAGATFQVEKVVLPKSTRASPASLRTAAVTTIVLKFVGMGADTDELQPATQKDQRPLASRDEDSADTDADDSQSDSDVAVELEPELELEPEPEALLPG
jgi:hypothetical protein